MGYSLDPLTPVERWLAEMLAEGALVPHDPARPGTWRIREGEGRPFRELKPDEVAAITGRHPDRLKRVAEEAAAMIQAQVELEEMRKAELQARLREIAEEQGWGPEGPPPEDG
jgi:hypothetical protein